VKPHWRLLIVVFPLLIAFSCAQRESGEALKREAERALRLEAELQKQFASLSEQTKEIRERLEKPDPKVAKAIPEYKSYNEQLIAGFLQIDQISRLIAARKHGEITPLALEGFKNSSGLASQLLQKGIAELEASIKAIDARRYSEVTQSNNKAQYFKAMAGLATVHEKIFFDVLNTLLLNTPASDRAPLFEQAAKTYPLIQRPGALAELAGALQRAYKEEDNAGNKKRMEAWLAQYKIPQAEATPTATQAGK
jgi:hypothetical protein